MVLSVSHPSFSFSLHGVPVLCFDVYHDCTPMLLLLLSSVSSVDYSYSHTHACMYVCTCMYIQWKTVAGRSQTYTNKIKTILGKHAHVGTAIGAVHKTASGYELSDTNGKSLGVFDDVVFACHPPQAAQILRSGKSQVDPSTLDCLDKVEYADNVIYVHSDPALMPARRRAWASWNCLGKKELLTTPKVDSKKGEAFEGGESGFGNVKNNNNSSRDNDDDKAAAALDGQFLEGEDGRMKAVYVTYWLNKLQTLDTERDIFVSLNPHQPPDPSKTYQRVILAHPQFNSETLLARKEIGQNRQGKDGLWFCGAWEGYGFHEDGCRSGFNVATKLAGVPLPWADGSLGNSKAMVLPPPDLSVITSGLTITKAFQSLYRHVTYHLPVAFCKRFIVMFLDNAVKKGKLVLKFNDGSTIEFGDGTHCGSDASPVTIRVFDPWFFVKTALEYDLGLAR